MKVIISHDVDHITVSEHKRDLVIPKFLVRNIIELTIGTITSKEFFLRLQSNCQKLDQLKDKPDNQHRF